MPNAARRTVPFRRDRLALLLSVVGALCPLATVAFAAASDWPTYRGAATRGGYIDATIELPAQLVWAHRPKQPPRPAWPPPARQSYWQRLGRLAARVTDDWAFQPVADRSHVYYGSSADDHLWCLDAATGQVCWRFATDGPIRYAPTVAGDRVFFGSDDGYVYCLDSERGTLEWKVRPAPRDHRIPGNGRIISAWPVRTGLVVDRGLVYATAGLYPSQGVFACALRTGDGSPIWKQRVDCSPQGYLLASDQRIYLPTGRGNPVALRRGDGKRIDAFDGVGGSYAVVTERELVAGPGNDGTLSVSDVASRDRFVSFPGEQLAVTPEMSYLLGGGKLRALDRTRFMQLSRSIRSAITRRDGIQKQLKKLPSSATPNGDDRQRTELRRQLGQVARQLDQLETQRQSCWQWTVAAAGHRVVLATGRFVITGGDQRVVAHRVDDGQIAWSHPVDGRALALALAHERLLVGTDRGTLYCFSGRRGERRAAAIEPRQGWAAAVGKGQREQRPQAVLRAPQDGTRQADRGGRPSALVEVARRAVRAAGRRRGFCLVLGVVDGRLASAIAAESELTVVVIDRDASAVRRCRRALIDAGIYGHRVSVHLVAGDRLPIADQTVNLTVSERGLLDGRPPDWSADEIQRVTRPLGGTIWLDARRRPTRRGLLTGAGRWTHQYGNAANTANSGDQLIGRHVELRWFGGPGPRRMVDRHLRGPAPLVENGRLLIPAQDALIGVDAYNGTELWQIDLPGSQRYSMPYDAGYMAAEGDRVAVAVGRECWLIDARNGTCAERIEVPAAAGSSESVWGYAALVDGLLFGTAQRPTASRTKASREQVEVAYTNGEPLVTGDAVFCIEPDGAALRWCHRDGLVINSTITLGAGRMYFVESRGPRNAAGTDGRVPLADLLAGPADLVAIDLATGERVWNRPVGGSLRQCRNILYLQYAHGLLVATGSRVGADHDSWYRIETFDATSGRPVWQAEHAAGKPNAFSHGEQVHHPAVLGKLLLAEPALYELATGRRIDMDGNDPPQPFVRPAGGCGTVSAAGHCLFYRASHPTLTDLSSGLAGQQRTYQLAPSRPGCWINIIPAGGLILIPEASSGCVCHYSLQTSMALGPVRAR